MFDSPVPVTELLLLLCFAGVFVWYTRRRNALTAGGALAAAITGFLIWFFAGWLWLVPLMFFFVSSTLLGKLNKSALAATDERQGKPRNAWQVCCNGGVYTVLAVFGAFPEKEYFLMLLSMAVATSDTWSSEIGIFYRQATYDLLGWNRVPPGLSGGVSLAGTLGGLAGSVLTAGLGALICPTLSTASLVLIGVGGFAGMLLDSLLGAGVQARYQTSDGMLTDKQTDWHRGGISWMSNDVVNLLSNALLVLLFPFYNDFFAMYAYLKGELTWKSPAAVVVEVQGVGYHVHIPLSTFSAIQNLEKATIYTHLIVREDAHTLFGFATQAERSLFIQLIGVTGVGATTAQLILSAMTVDEVRASIIGEQAHVLQRVKGIGAKTAKQIILDLKDKLAKESPDAPVLLPMADNAMREEAMTALISLGFSRIAVQKALNHILKENPELARVEDLIKAALKALAG